MSRGRSAKVNEDLAAEKAAQAVETVRNIRTAAAAARYTVKTFRDSGAIEEIAEAARDKGAQADKAESGQKG